MDFFVFTSQNLLITVYNISGRGCSHAGDGIPERARARAENPPFIICGKWGEMVMNVNDLITLIGSVGFPIAMCLYMTVTFNKTLETLDDRILALSTRIDTLIDKLLEK